MNSLYIKKIQLKFQLEKEELVNLVMIHAAKNPHIKYSQSERGSFEDANPFDNIKHSCQTFFTKISDNLTDNLKDFNFDMKSTTSNATSPTTSEPPPRSSSSHSSVASSISPVSPDASASSSQSRRTTPTSPKHNNTPIPSNQKTMISSEAEAGPSTSYNQRQVTVDRNVDNSSPGQSGCECSDEEVITTFKKRRSQSKVNSPISTVDSAFEEQNPSGQSSNSATLPKPPETADSSGSSFEELGAVGGNNVASRIETDNWQIVDKDEQEGVTNENTAETIQDTDDGEPAILRSKPNNLNQLFDSRDRRIVSRRRSDGYVFNRGQSEEGSRLYSPLGCNRIDETSDNEAEDDPRSSASGRRKRMRNCVKCGKSKSNIKRHVLKFAKHLDSTNLSETEFKQELKEFVKYLENRAKSIDCSDTESNLDVNSGGEGAVVDDILNIPEELLPHLEYFLEDELYGNYGIHVYAHNEENILGAGGSSRFDQRFLNLAEFTDL